MNIMRTCRHHPWATILFVQGLFLLVQVAIFYPCLVGTEGAGAQARVFETNRNKRSIRENEGQNTLVTGQRYEPNWASLDKRPIPQWFDDAKFGIFIHWGVFSVPSYVKAGSKGLAEWFWYYMQEGKPSEEYHTSKAIKSVTDFMKENYPPHFQYQDFAPLFTAEFFKPEEWADIFNNSGARYVVLTSKHHDGYTLWGSKYSWNWNSVDIGPHKDLVGELGNAVKKTGLKYGLYHSLFEWYNPFYLDDRANKYKTQTFIKEKLTPELTEIVNVYKPDILWTDGHWIAPCSYYNCTNFLAWLYNESPVRETVVTNDRWGTDVICKHGDFLTCSDRYNPSNKQIKKWENCMTIDKESWGYRRNAKLSEYYTIEELVKILAKTVSNGGNLLMNIGPTADGRIPPVFEERLRQMGKWLQVNGEAIYKTRMWHHTTDSTSKNVFYTKKKETTGTVIYAIVTEWPKSNQLTLTVPKSSKTTRVSWLGYKNPIQYKLLNEGMNIQLPTVSLTEIPCLWGWVFKLEELQNADLDN